MATTVQDKVRQQVADGLEKSTRLKDPNGIPDYDEITVAINNSTNTEFLQLISEAIEDRLASSAIATDSQYQQPEGQP